MTHPVRSAAQAEKDAVVFKALGNGVRLQIVAYVAASPEGQVSAGEIVDRFDLSQPTISHHLRVLREAGVLTTFKSSTFVYYRFAPRLRETVAAVLPSEAAAAPPAASQKPATATKPSTLPKPTAAKSATQRAVKKATAMPTAAPKPEKKPKKSKKDKGAKKSKKKA